MHGGWLSALSLSVTLFSQAIVARWLVDAAVRGDSDSIPAELRRAEFGELLCLRLRKLGLADLEARTHRGWKKVDDSRRMESHSDLAST